MAGQQRTAFWRLTGEGRRWPDEALCCGTFWLEDDFLLLGDTLNADAIEIATERTQDCHDAGIGFNWDYLQAVIENVKRGG